MSKPTTSAKAWLLDIQASHDRLELEPEWRLTFSHKGPNGIQIRQEATEWVVDTIHCKQLSAWFGGWLGAQRVNQWKKEASE